MKSKVKGLLAGLLIGFLVIGIIESLGHLIFPVPKGINLENKALLKNYIDSLPLPAFLFIIGAHGIGTFTGSFIANKISDSIGHIGLIISLLFLILTVVNLLIVPYHPIWFVITDILFTFISGWIAFKIALKTGK